MDNFIKEYVAAQSSSYYTRFWANTALTNGLSVKYDGKEFLCKPEKIRVVDLGELAGQCLCGHTIRYEFWFDHLGPIGSSCIKTMTGLDGQDLRMLIKGAELAKKDGEELQRTIKTYLTFSEQLGADQILAERFNFVHEIDKIPECIQKFVVEDVPLPNPMKNLLYRIYNEEGKIKKVKDMYGDEVYSMALGYKDVVGFYGEKPPKFVETINDIGGKIIEMKATGKAVEFFKRLYKRAENKRFLDAYSVLAKLQVYDLGEFWNNLIQEYIRKGDQYGLTDGEVAFILDKSASGKPALCIRFKNKLELVDQEYDTPEGQEKFKERRQEFFDKRNQGESKPYNSKEVEKQLDKSDESMMRDQESSDSNPW